MSEMIERVANAIIAELAAQRGTVYFWDEADGELFEDGKPEPTDIRTKATGEMMVDRFDMEGVARKAVEAMRHPGVSTVNEAHLEPTNAGLSYYNSIIEAALR